MALIDLELLRASLSYDDVKGYTGWDSHVMVNDYIGITASTAAIIEQIDLNSNSINFNFQYLHGDPDFSSSYVETGVSYSVGDKVSQLGNEYAAKIAIADPSGVFDPLNWDQVSTVANYDYLKTHEGESIAHGSGGDIVGTLDFCTELVGGVVLLMDLVNDAITSTAEVVIVDVGLAPVTYNQAYANLQTALINDIKAKHNTLLADLNSAVAQINDLISKSKTANQMNTI